MFHEGYLEFPVTSAIKGLIYETNNEGAFISKAFFISFSLNSSSHINLEYISASI